jgi:hypothetical protein
VGRAVRGCCVVVRAGRRPVGLRSRVHAKARSREVPMRKGQFFARALGPRRWSRFSAKAIRGQGVVRQAGPHVHALALGRGRPVGPGARKSRAGVNSFSGAGFWLRWHFVIADNYNLTTNDFTTKAQRIMLHQTILRD